jgi:protein ATS1
MLFALGSNGSGQLGLGHKDDVNTPTPCTLPIEYQSSPIVSIRAGGNHTLLQMPGEVFAAGEASDGRFPLLNITQKSPQMFDAAVKSQNFSFAVMSATQCSATWEASTFVDNVDRVFTGGTGNRGELGLGEGLTEAPEPKLIKDFPPSGEEQSIIDVAASMSHTVVVTFDGNVYGWGAGRKGQLGQPAQDCWTPRKIDGIPFEVYRAVCGREFTYLVGAPESGDHVILGSNKYSVVSSAPKTLPTWKDIGSSWGSIFVLLESGKILSWGRNDHGQLCPPDLPKINQMAVGSEHVVALTEDGRVITWGWGEHGNCGSPVDEAGDVKNRWNELEVQGEVATLGAGCATTFIATTEKPT